MSNEPPTVLLLSALNESVDAAAKIRYISNSGFAIAYNWTKDPCLQPLVERGSWEYSSSANFAQRIIEAVWSTAICIFIVPPSLSAGQPDAHSSLMFSALGAALVLGKPTAVLCSEGDQNIILAHPLISRFSSWQQLMAWLHSR